MNNIKIGTYYEKLLGMHNTYLAYRRNYRNNKHTKEGLVAYTDGSLRDPTYSYGCVLLFSGRIIFELWGAEENFLWQQHGGLYGEFLGAVNAINLAKANGYSSLIIVTDSSEARRLGGDKKFRCFIQEQYKEFIRGCGIELKFRKVIAHSGVVLNNLADKLKYIAFLEFIIKKELNLTVDAIRNIMENIFISIAEKRVNKTDKFWVDL
jgi:ribonuclease HI